MASASLAPSGYSGKPLPKKLGYKPGMVAAFAALPDELAPLAESVAFAEVAHESDWRSIAGERRFDLIHAFTRSRAEIESALPRLQDALRRDGMIWVSWPKKSSGVTTDITEDTIREVCLPLGLVDVKVCAVDSVWSGLKLVVRKELRWTLASLAK